MGGSMAKTIQICTSIAILGIGGLSVEARSSQNFAGSQTQASAYGNGRINNYANSDPKLSVISNSGSKSVSTTTTSNNTGGNNLPIYGTGYAYADLASGIMRASSVTTTTFTPYVGGGFGAAIAEAGISDILNFSIAGAGASTITPITVTAHLDGSYSGSIRDTLTFFQLLVCANDCGGIPYNGRSLGGSPNILSRSVFQFEAQPQTSLEIGNIVQGWNSYQIIYQSINGFDFSGVYGLRGPTPVIGIQALLETSAGNGGIADFSHTSKLGLKLPDGVSYISQSGVFLSADVPEPSVWTLLVAGFGITGAAIRRQRKATAVPRGFSGRGVRRAFARCVAIGRGLAVGGWA